MTDHILSKPVLVVDSEPLTRVAIVEALQGHGNTVGVDWAGDAHTARTMLRRKAYSLVLLDEQVPGIISRDLARSVHHTSPQTRVVLMDCLGSGDLRETAARCEFDGYLSKPFTVRAVCELVETFTGSPRKRDHYAALPLEGQADAKADPPAEPFSGPGALSHALEQPRLGYAPPELSASTVPLPSVRESLELLLTDTRARCVLLITHSGYSVDAVGQTKGLHLPTLSALIAANFAAAAELSRLLGNPADFRASHHQGPDSHIYTYKANDELLLAVIFGKDSRAGAVWLFAKRAAAALTAAPAAEEPAVANNEDLTSQMEAQWANLLDTGRSSAPAAATTKILNAR